MLFIGPFFYVFPLVLVILYIALNYFVQGRKYVCVVVLGDIGRSPRMQYHSLSLAKEQYNVDLIGYGGSKCHRDVTYNPKIHIRQIAEPPVFVNYMPRLLAYILKVIWQTVTLGMTLLLIPKCGYVLIQNPPCIPTIAIAWFSCLLRGSKLIIDWHNYGYTILGLTLEFIFGNASSHMRYPGVPITFDFRTSEDGGFNFYGVDEEEDNKIKSLLVSNSISDRTPFSNIKQKDQITKDTSSVNGLHSNTKSSRTKINNVFKTDIPRNVNDNWQSTNFFTSDQLKRTAMSKPNNNENAKLIKIEEANSIIKKARNGNKVENEMKSKFIKSNDPSYLGSLGIDNRKFDDWNKYLLGHYNWLPTSGKKNYDVSSDKYPIVPNMNSDILYEINKFDHNRKNKAISKILPNIQSQVIKNVNTKGSKKKSSTHPVIDKSDLKNELENLITDTNIKSESKPNTNGEIKSSWNVKLRETKPVIPNEPKTIPNVSAIKEKINPINTSKRKRFNSLRFSPLREIKPVTPVVPTSVSNVTISVIIPQPIPFRTSNHGISIVNTPLRDEITPIKPVIQNKGNKTTNDRNVKPFTTEILRQSMQTNRRSKSNLSKPKKLTSKLKKISPGIISQIENVKEKLKPVQNKNTVKKKIQHLENNNNNKPKPIKVYLSQLPLSPSNQHENHKDDEKLLSSAKEAKNQKQVNRTDKTPMSSWRSRLQKRVESGNPSPTVIATKVSVSPAKVITHKRVWPELESLMQEVKQLNVIIHENESKINYTRLMSNSIHITKSEKASIPRSHAKTVKSKFIHKLGKQLIKDGKVLSKKSWRNIYRNRKIKKSKNHLNSSKTMGSNLQLGDILSLSYPGRTILIPNNQAASDINKIRAHKHKTSRLDLNHLSKPGKETHSRFARKLLKIPSRKSQTDQSVDLSMNEQPNDVTSSLNSIKANDNDPGNTRQHNNALDKTPPKRKYLSEILNLTSSQQIDIGDQHTGTNWNSLQHNIVPSYDATLNDSPTTKKPVPLSQLETTKEVIKSQRSHDSNNYDNIHFKNPESRTPLFNTDNKIPGTSGIKSNTLSDSLDLSHINSKSSTGKIISDKVPEFMNPFGLTLFDSNMKPLSLEDMINILQEENVSI